MPPKGGRTGGGLVISAFLGIGLALLLIWSVNRQLLPIVTSMATTKVKNAVTRKVEQTIGDYNCCAEYLLLRYGHAGQRRIRYGNALRSNMTRLNSMRNGNLLDISKAMDTLDTKALSIPLGNSYGISFLSGRGSNCRYT
jgi:hypothetical protein